MAARPKKPADQAKEATADQAVASPEKPAPEIKGAETASEARAFIAVSLILHDGEIYSPGETLTLTETQHAALARARGVIGSWADAADDGA